MGWGGTGASGADFFDTALFRADGGCTDTDNNSADFASGAPNPRNSSSAVHTCGAVPAPATVLLLASGLVGVVTSAAWSARRRVSGRP